MTSEYAWSKLHVNLSTSVDADENRSALLLLPGGGKNAAEEKK